MPRIVEAPSREGIMPAGWRRSNRCLGFKEVLHEQGGPSTTGLSWRSMEVLQDPQAPAGKRLVPMLESVDRSDLFIRRKSTKEGQGRRRHTVGTDQPSRELRLAEVPAESATSPERDRAPGPPAPPVVLLGDAAVGRPAASPGRVRLAGHNAADSRGRGGGSSWASAGLPFSAGVPPVSLRDSRCVTAPAPAPPIRIDLPEILRSHLPPARSKPARPRSRPNRSTGLEELDRSEPARPRSRPSRSTGSLPKMGAL